MTFLHMGLRSCRAAVHTHGSPSFTPQPRGEVVGRRFSWVLPWVALMNRADAVYCFGGFELQPRERRLLCEARPVPLPGKAFDLLVCLVSRAPRLVKKDELLTVVWPDTVVEETNLNYTISLIRKALLDGRGGQRYIETVPRQCPIRGRRPSPGRRAHRGQRSTR